MQKLLTIVVPVYKVEQYINKCLDSCIIYKEDGTLDEDKMNQLEVIIVNDGTPDRSAELSREYTIRYPQTFRQIDQENRGHGGAWNHGLKEATGKYLRFLDSDDWLTNLDKLMDKLAKTDADLVFTLSTLFYQNLNTENVENTLKVFTLETRNISNIEFKDVSNYSFAGSHNCTYKTELIKTNDFAFDEKAYYDDSILLLHPFIHAKSYISLDMILYHYLIGRPEQTMNKDVLSKHHSFILLAANKMLNYYKDNKFNISSFHQQYSIYLMSKWTSDQILKGLLHTQQYLEFLKDYKILKSYAKQFGYNFIRNKKWHLLYICRPCTYFLIMKINYILKMS